MNNQDETRHLSSPSMEVIPGFRVKRGFFIRVLTVQLLQYRHQIIYVVSDAMFQDARYHGVVASLDQGSDVGLDADVLFPYPISITDLYAGTFVRYPAVHNEDHDVRLRQPRDIHIEYPLLRFYFPHPHLDHVIHFQAIFLGEEGLESILDKGFVDHDIEMPFRL